MIAKEEAGRKESVETALERMEVVEVSEARGMGLTHLWEWMRVRARTCWTRTVRACLGPNVLKMTRGLVVATDA